MIEATNTVLQQLLLLSVDVSKSSGEWQTLDPDRFHSMLHLIWVYSVCHSLSVPVPVVQFITVFQLSII